MSNKTKELEDQASELRKLVNEVQQEELVESTETNDFTEENEIKTEETREVDILNLPPRKEVHSKNNTRAHVKMSKPFMRLVLVIVIILAVLFGLYYVWGEELLNVI
ncbi:hypothetical protein [Virgibacillus ndiopensis]|uniref:hypothetical protein n=1 Tax=Virgibacillus ndiopensis TaxID=2004408 RepID=UPI000C08323E|nr:hypothetical protein [Virgibacillus ndiopensis]